MNNKRHYLAFLLGCACYACGPFAQIAVATVITGTQNFQVVSRLTGPVGSDAINPTWQVGVQGTDLGHMVRHNGKSYFLFGDTFNAGGNQGSGGPDFRNNVMAWTTDTNPTNGVTFDGWVTRPNGTAKQVIFPGSEPNIPGFQPITYIPTGAISVDDKIYAWSMRVDWDGFAGVPGDDWMLGYAGLARWREGDSQFTNVNSFRFEAPNGGPYSWGGGSQGPGNFGMVAASYRSPLERAGDDHVYIWGTPGGREGGVKLARVLPNQIENLSAYEFFDGEVDGTPQWVDNEFDAQKIIPSRPEGGSGVGEMSVMYNEAMRAWTMTSISGGPVNFHIRYADNPWGPWSDPINIPVATLPNRWGPYAPYMNPLYVENDGETIYFTMSYWEPYDVYLAKVDLNLDFRTRWTGNIGTWAIGTNWSHGRPTAEHHTTLDNGGTIRINTAESVRAFDVGTGQDLGGTVEMVGSGALTVHAGGFRLGQGEGSNATLTMTSGSIEILDPTKLFVVGDRGNATATISGGSITGQTFSIAHQPTASGNVELGGDAVITTTGDRFQIGRLRNSASGERSTGSLTMTGGTINVNAGSGVADFVPAFEGVATVDMSGGTINVANNFVAAVAGASGQALQSQATISQSGGTINTGGVTLGERGISDYTLSGTGQINARGMMRLGWFSGSESTFTQSGGTVNLALDNPALSFVGLKVGERGQGTYTISGGELHVPGRLWVAELSGSVGQMGIHGGTVNIGEDLALGLQGNAELTQTNGELNIGGSLHVAAAFASSVGVHNHSGGTLSVSGNLNVGRDNGDGTSHISGGNVTVDGLVRVWSTGTLNYLGGSIDAGALQIDGGGLLRLELGPPRGEMELAPLALTGNAALGGTLDVSLADDFAPAADDSFEILTAAGGISGTFANVQLPELTGGLLWNVAYGTNSLTLAVAALPGDFNRDGMVDAADYTVWRDGLGGLFTEAHYDEWRDNFGASAGSGASFASSSQAAVPEPASYLLLLLAGAICANVRRHMPAASAAVRKTHLVRLDGGEFEFQDGELQQSAAT